MLELKKIRKTYTIGDIVTTALDNVSVAFREKEFVAILGPSGSGKTTCLNIIGGLDRYDSGELSIKGKNTSEFKDRDWDSYRNNSIGFVFQSYNLIMHLGIVANVELGMTLSGVSAAEKRKRAIEVLKQVGLAEHLHKKPNQLSGGQMQRVAIARALANNPEILLCDEPTGALDTDTSKQILDLIKSLSSDRLVIMVTHNPELAEQYADRIIRFKDGNITEDTHPHEERPKPDMFKLLKTSMSFVTALKISSQNLMTKKGRTFLTAFASSIGIIGIGVILSLSSGFKTKVDEFQQDSMAEFPIMVSQQGGAVDTEAISGAIENRAKRGLGNPENTDTETVYLYDASANQIMHTNVFTDEYLDYLNNIDKEYCSRISYTRIATMNLLRNIDGTITPVAFKNIVSDSSNMLSGGGMSSLSSGMSSIGLASYPVEFDTTKPNYIEANYNLLAGSYPSEVTDLVLIVDDKNCLDVAMAESLGFAEDGKMTIPFSEIVGTEMKVISNNNYYVKTPMGGFVPGTVEMVAGQGPARDLKEMYDADGNITVKITGIVRQKNENDIAILGLGIAYSDALTEMVIQSDIDSEIVKAQQESNVNVMTGAELDETNKQAILSYLGGNATPYFIMIYPTSFDAKQQVTDYLDSYNQDKDMKDKVIYTDLAATITTLSSGIMDAITVVLIAFAAISLVVSLIMICIITYTSVIERTKEIGILRALGARKKDITRVFDAETCILGVFSGVLGVVIAWALTFPINHVILSMTDLPNVANLPFWYAVALVTVSTILTMLGGHIPARMASKKDAVVALRME
ncbi:MAG: ATP-binding cassette domain-containing protein [Clostridiales bacterium]|nr:ATP-binding cassette domain-containing protein [Clostridiales bacterium]